MILSSVRKTRQRRIDQHAKLSEKLVFITPRCTALFASICDWMCRVNVACRSWLQPVVIMIVTRLKKHAKSVPAISRRLHLLLWQESFHSRFTGQLPERPRLCATVVKEARCCHWAPTQSTSQLSASFIYHDIYEYVISYHERNIPVCCNFSRVHSHQIALIWSTFDLVIVTRKPSYRWQTRATWKSAKNCSNSTWLQRCRWQYWPIFIRLAVVASEIYEIPRNSPKIPTYGVQGHPRSSILVSMESPYVTSY